MLNIETNKEISIASFEGNDRLNVIVAQSVKEQLNKFLINKGTKLILNLEGISFVDSSGFGSLISALKTAKENDSLFKICNVSTDVMELIKLMQLHTVFEIHENLDTCINSF